MYAYTNYVTYTNKSVNKNKLQKEHFFRMISPNGGDLVYGVNVRRREDQEMVSSVRYFVCINVKCMWVACVLKDFPFSLS